MTPARHHAEWLSLVETSGPFLSMPVLLRVFPQGLDQRDPAKASRLREAYEDWLERGSKQPAVHHAWIRHVLTELLEYPPEFLVEGQAIPPGMEAVMANFGETLRPEFVLKHREAGHKPLLLIEHYAPDQDLEKPVAGKTWKASPGTRMMELLHAADVPLGLVTNGEQWMIVYAPRGETTGFGSWYADLWMQEPITLRAFHSLLHLRRFIGVDEPETLAALYAESSKDQQEVTDQLGYQVRRAVEMLVQAFDRIDTESDRKLLAGVKEKDLYDSALTIMMRLVFLFSAEERGLLLLGDPLYDQHYAVSTLSELLRERADQHGEEVLERRHDAWCRLLATFRAVHAGVEHEAMRLPPYGGTLFNPDRYPFLEGRVADTRWQTTPSKPLPINNRVVLHLLEALQVLRVKVPGGGPAEARRVSFRALDIEQIGHVYEGLLDHTAKRAIEVILGLAGSKKSEPEIPLSKLEELATKGTDALVEFVNEETGRSEKALRKDLEKLELVDDHALLIACGQDPLLAKRIKPFAALLRDDDFGHLVVISTGSVYVTTGSDRRSTGTHYTPRSLTEPIVQHTLEPLVYIGPSEGKPKAEWKLKSAREILALKVCDMTMGSGAFLVQTCRYLAERLVEAWENAEKANPGKFLTTPEGDFSAGDPTERLIPADLAERIAVARRYVADRCLYGVDINPMAVEMAKLSLWLITLRRDRPFTFLDHALKCGDSLLGVSTLKQVENFSLRSGERQVTFATANLFRYVEDASAKRSALEELPSNDYAQIQIKARLHDEAEAATAKVKTLADCLIAFELRGLNGDAYEEQRVVAADHAELSMRKPLTEFQTYAREQLRGHRPFHWSVEYPEVFGRGGFDAFVGNPPFVKGHFISRFLGDDMRQLISRTIAGTSTGLADYSTFFLVRGVGLAKERGQTGLIITNSVRDGDSRAVGIELPKSRGAIVRLASPDMPWPGTADVTVCFLILTGKVWDGVLMVSGKVVTQISSQLTAEDDFKPYPIGANSGQCFIGSYLLGDGFIIEPETQLPREENDISDVVLPYMNGQELFSFPEPSPVRKAICFWDWSLEEAQDKYPALTEHLRLTVKPTRDEVNRDRRRELWWIYAENTPGMYHATGLGELFKKHPSGWTTTKHSLRHVIAKAKSSDTWAFELLPARMIFDQSLAIFATEKFSFFATVQSEHHWVWAGKLVSGNKGEEARKQGGAPISYTPSTVFETFPFPMQSAELENIGARYHELRRKIMQTRQEGLTKTYNRFHDRGEQSADIARLRVLHEEMDQAVAAAYGWSDLKLDHGFHPTKQGERFTISESARRIVLDKLLELNHQRYEEEVKAGLHAKGAKKSKATLKTKAGTPAQVPQELDLEFGRPAVAKPKLDSAATALVLIPFLLFEASRTKVSLRMTELKLAFDFITNPALMKSSAKPADRMAVDAWIGKWQSPAGPEWFIKTLRKLAGGTVRATTDEDDPPMALVVTPPQPESPELGEGLRLAVRVARSAGALPPEDRLAVLHERRSIFTTV
jgi:hypothetical protein